MFAFLRWVRPVAIFFGKFVIVSKHGDVCEVFDRSKDFNLSEILGPKMPWGPMLLSLDWFEQHNRERHLLKSIVFKTEDISAIKRRVADRCSALIEKKRAEGEIDIVTDLCHEIMIDVIHCYFGVPLIGNEQEMARILVDVASFLLLPPPAQSKREDQAYRSMVKLIEAVRNGIRRRKEDYSEFAGDPTSDDDLLARLVKKLHAAGRMQSWFDEDWIRRYITGLATTGGGTLAQATTHAIDRLIAHPAGLQKARQIALKLQQGGDTTPLHHIVYEALRFKPMLPLIARLCLRETIIAEGTNRARTIPAGATILAPPIAAMFDPEAFTNPSLFDSSRPMNHYVHFGFGPHRCFGKYVADTVMVEIIRSLVVLPNLRRASGLKGRVQYDGPAVASLQLRFDPEATGTLP